MEYLLGPDEGEIRWGLDGTLTTIKASGELTGERLGLVEEMARLNDGIPMHRHAEDAESFYVLEGQLTFWLGESPPQSAPAGSFVHIPGGTAHSFRVDSDVARYLIITTPRHERFYRAISDPATHRDMPGPVELDMDRVEAACLMYGVEILGPPPG